MSTRPISLALLALLLGASACSPPPDHATGQVRLALVRDSYLFKVIQVVQLRVLRASTPTGLLTCPDLRGSKFRPDDPRFEELVKPAPAVPLSGHSPTKELVFETFAVPAGERLVFLAQGLTQYGTGTFAVAQGCQDELIFDAGGSEVVDIDITASTGAACSEVGDCQTGLGCERTSGETSPFRGGYCAKIGCGGDQDCPPGARCISSSAHGGICLRSCETISDCTWVAGGQAVQDCVGRTGPTAGGCAAVCVFPEWSKTSKCTP